MERVRRILVDASKLKEGTRDGCYRYTSELVRALIAETSGDPSWKLDLLLCGKIVSASRLDRWFRPTQGSRTASARNVVKALVGMRQSVANLIQRHASPALVEYLRRMDRSVGATASLKLKHQGRPMGPAGYDVVHLMLPQSYRFVRRFQSGNILVTIHDCTHIRFRDCHEELNATEADRGVRFGIERQAHFLAVSETSRRELMDYYPIPESDVTTILEAVDRTHFRPVLSRRQINRVLRRYHLPLKPYLLALSTLEPRKNLIGAIRAFSRLKESGRAGDVQLVIAGRKGWKFDGIFGEPGANSKDVHFTGFVADKDLPALYSGALALAFVSYYEGFGLPALEAMTCGTPVIFGNCGALPEVVGEGGLPANPHDVDDIANQFGKIITSEGLRQELAAKGLLRAEMFSWQTAAQQTLAIYQMLAARNKGRATAVQPVTCHPVAAEPEAASQL